MTNFIFISGKWWWVKDYPERIDHPCEDAPFHDCPMCVGYNQACLDAVNNGKVEVAPEDQERTYDWVHLRNGWDGNGPIQSKWKPTEGKVYEVSVEMEIEYQENYEIRKVARIKPVKE